VLVAGPKRQNSNVDGIIWPICCESAVRHQPTNHNMDYSV